MRKVISRQFNIEFSRDVRAVKLVFQNNETAAMLVFQTNPVGVELSLSLSLEQNKMRMTQIPRLFLYNQLVRIKFGRRLRYSVK